MLDYMYQRQNRNKPNPSHNELINPPPHPISPLCVCSNKPVETDMTVRPPTANWKLEFNHWMFRTDHKLPSLQFPAKCDLSNICINATRKQI